MNQDIISTALRYAVRKELPSKITSLKGFFFVAGRDLPLSGLDQDVIKLYVANVYVSVPTAAIDAYVYMNVDEGNTVPSFGAGLDGIIVVEFGIRAMTCTTLYGRGTVCATLEGNYDNSNGSVGLGGCVGVIAELGLRQEFPSPLGCQGTIFDKSISQGVSFNFSLSPALNVDFSWGLGNCSTCNK